MKHLRAVIIKFILFTAVLFVTLGFLYGVDFGEVLTISLILTIVAYLIGDMVILPQFGNIAATVADFGLTYLGTWLIGAMIIDEPIRLGLASFFTALIVAIAEAFFHRYLTKSVIHDDDKPDLNRIRPRYQTEFAEETFPEVPAKKQNKRKADQRYSTEFGEEMHMNIITKKSSKNYTRVNTDTEFGEENFILKKQGSNTQKSNQSQLANNKYQTEFGEENPNFTSSNITKDSSYYLSGYDFQAGFNFVPVTNDQSKGMEAKNETANHKGTAQVNHEGSEDDPDKLT